MSLTTGFDDSASAAHDPATGRFKRGHKSDYRTRQALVKERLAALQAAYKANSAADLAMLGLAAIHLVDAEKARSRDNRVRASNAASRILKTIPRRPEREATVDELLKGGR